MDTSQSRPARWYSRNGRDVLNKKGVGTVRASLVAPSSFTLARSSAALLDGLLEDGYAGGASA